MTHAIGPLLKRFFSHYMPVYFSQAAQLFEVSLT